MPRRNAEDSNLTFAHFHVFTFGSDEDLIGSFGSLDRAAAEWNRVRAVFLERWNLWGMPQAWWRFEADIPEELRVGPASVLTDADADALRELDEARRRFLEDRGIDPTPPIGRPFASA